MSVRSFALGTVFGAALAVTLGIATSVVAGVSPERLEAARALIGATVRIKEFEKIVTEVIKSFSSDIMAETHGRSERDVVRAMLDEAREAIRENRGTYLENIARIYATHLSKGDLDAAAGFFSSRAGKRWIGAQDVILNETVQYAGEQGGGLRDRIISRTLQRLEQQGYTTRD
jgi:hypothetical protein